MNRNDAEMHASHHREAERPAGFAVLAHLESVALPPECVAAVEELRLRSHGSAVWRSRKAAEARDLFALAEIAPRMSVLVVEGQTDLRALIRLQAPVPCLPEGASELIVGDEVDLVLKYPEDIMHKPLPGYGLVEILRPHDVQLPNVARGPNQLLCLGANVPRNYPLREAVLATYAALTMQAVTIDERDTAGVMNPTASLWWQANTSRIPLSTEPFLPARVAEDKPGLDNEIRVEPNTEPNTKDGGAA